MSAFVFACPEPDRYPVPAHPVPFLGIAPKVEIAPTLVRAVHSAHHNCGESAVYTGTACDCKLCYAFAGHVRWCGRPVAGRYAALRTR